MGGSKTTTKESGNSTNVVQLPKWMTDAGERTFNSAEATAKASPITGYTAPITAGSAGNQMQATQQASQMAHAGQPALTEAQGMTRAATGGAPPTMTGGTFGTAQAEQYMSPYQQEVQQRTVGEMGRQNAMELDSLGDNAAASKAYGGNRHAVLEAETRKGQGANMIDYLARSNQAGFENAQSQFERDRQARMGAETQTGNWAEGNRDRELAAGGLMGQLGSAQSEVAGRGIDDLVRTGTMDQATQQDKLGADYNEFLRMQDAPMDRYKDLMSILSGTPRDVTTNAQYSGKSVQKSSPGLFNQILGAAQVGAAAFSDRRLKRDIEPVGRLSDGLGVYRYRYLWSDDLHTGVMADEVAVLRPEALGPPVLGFATVDYSKLGALA